MEKRIGSFISSIVLICVAIFCSAITFKLSLSIPQEGVQSLSYIVTIPILIIFYLVTFGLNISAVFTSMKTLKSDSRVIKIFAIVFLVLSVALLGLNGYSSISIFTNL